MHRPSLIQTARARLQPRFTLAVLAAMGLLSMARISIGEVPIRLELVHLVLGCVLVLAVMALGPVPWQWTGDSRRLAPLPRGLGQALVWNAAWLTLLMLAFAPLRPPRTANPQPLGNPLRAHLRQILRTRGLASRTLPPVFGLLPLVLAAGWLMARFQATEGDRKEAEAGRQAMAMAAREAQERALKAQLDPHVLYNALGGISELIREDPARAEASVLSLAELYRKLTAMGRQTEVTLGDERRLVADYLEVEQLRLGARLQVAWDWPEALDARRVPPLLIQPLVENAIKHGLAPLREGGKLLLSAAADGAGLRLRVADQGAPLVSGWRPGTGLANLSERLALLGGGSRLELRQEDTWTVADLRLFPGGRP